MDTPDKSSVTYLWDRSGQMAAGNLINVTAPAGEILPTGGESGEGKKLASQKP
jgi:hypothetical protein